MGGLVSDVRHALRSWLRRPAFAAVALLTFTLAIGANTAMYSVIDTVLLESPPYREADRLVLVTQTMPAIGWERGPISYPNWADLRVSTRSMTDMAAYRALAPLTVSDDGLADQIPGTLATGNLFAVLGVEAIAGRAFSEADTEPGAPDVIVLSHGLWQARYGGAADVVGRTIRVDGRPRVVVGVMPAWFEFPRAADQYWVPTRRTEDPNGDRDTHHLQLIARLGPGATADAARAELVTLFDDMRARYPDIFGANQPNVESLQAVVSGPVRPMLALLAGAVALLLAIACANLTNLMLMRSATRSREWAVRSALGAGRGRLIRQLLTESGLLALVGGAGGVLLAIGGTRLISVLGPASLPRRGAIAVDGSVLVFTLVVSVICAAVVGAVPALRGFRGALHDGMREGARSTSDRRTGRVQAGLAIAQIALALMLLASAGLLVRSYALLAGQSPGFSAAGVLSARVSPPSDEYTDFARLDNLFNELLERARALPGVGAAGATWGLPFSPNWASGNIVIEGTAPASGEEPSVGMYPIRGDYFDAMGIPLLAGRTFLPEDERADAPPVVVINEAMATRFWPGQSAVGKRFKRGSAEDAASLPWTTVIGVTGDVRGRALDAAPEPEMYRPHAAAQWAREVYLVVRTDGDPLDLVAPLRSELRALDSSVPFSDVRTMSDRISASVAEPRVRTFLVACFAVVGGLLALVGIYGVIAYAVAQRSREIGVRLAFGARRAGVMRLVLSRGGRLIAAGLALGLLGALGASQVVAKLAGTACPDAGVPWPAACGVLYDIEPTDPATWAAVVTLLTLSALAACWVPARRASRLDPMVTLREE